MQPHKIVSQNWVRLHDRYDTGGYVDMTGRYHVAEAPHACCATGKETSSS